MKKFVVLLAVVAMTLVTSAVMAAEVTVGGEVAIRSRDFSNMDLNEKAADSAGNQHRDTQNRVKIDVNAKAGDVKGKIQVWKDFETWGRFESSSGVADLGCIDGNGNGKCGDAADTNLNDATTGEDVGGLKFREAWVSFPLPGTPVTVTGGHQLLTIANGWFFRSMHFGSDAWVVSMPVGAANLAFVNVKVAEGNAAKSDDYDAYALLAGIKLSDDMKLGFDLTNVKNRTAKASATAPERTNLINIGANFNGKLGPVALKAQLDFQTGEVDDLTAGGVDNDYKGNQIVVQGSVPAGPATVNFTVARGSGDDPASTSTDIETYQNFLDVDPHYTFLYEYKINTVQGAKNTGFANTTALGVGASFAATKSLTIGADFWHLQSTEKVASKVGTGNTSDIGQEIDVKVSWKVADNLAWNWVAGIFMPGDGMGKDDATGVQGILSFTF